MNVDFKLYTLHYLNQPSKAKTGSWYHKFINIAFVAGNVLISALI